MYHDSKVHGANMGPIWGRQDPGGSHVGPMNFAIWVAICMHTFINLFYIVSGFDQEFPFSHKRVLLKS